MSDYDAATPAAHPPPPPRVNSAPADWQRLDPRMLLVHPVREVIRFLPAVIAFVFVGSSSGGFGWQFLAILVPVALGLARYLTTTYRIAEERVELRTGLLNRRVTSTPLDRVRTIDLTSSPIHRVLGLTTLRIGTGTGGDADRLDLDGLPAPRARELRADLLGQVHRDVAAVEGVPNDGSDNFLTMPESELVVAFEPSWLRFAPLTSSGLVIAAAALGAASQLMATFDLWDSFELDGWSLDVSIGLLAGVGLVLFALVVAALAVLGYVVANWNFTLARSAGAWRVARGLLTTRETTLDEDRIAGVTLTEGLGVRLLHGARLSAIATGLDRTQATASVLVPPAPLSVSLHAAQALIGSSDSVVGPLLDHGPAAARRRYVRALVPATLLSGGLLAALIASGAPWVLLALAAVPPAVGFALARDRIRSLGHANISGHVVARSGSLARQRNVLGASHVIGWNFRSSWFQRRVGLTTASATMAGGRQSVSVLDAPEYLAVALALDTTPEVIAPFIRDPSASTGH